MVRRSGSLYEFVTAKVNASIRYEVFITDDIGCVDTHAVVLQLLPQAMLTLPGTLRVTWGYPLHINPTTNGTSFNWLPASGVSNPFAANPVITPDSSMRYVLETATGAGCRASDSIYVLVESAIHLPNAFAPDNGINPVFRILHTGIRSLESFRVYNRWGNCVFETRNIDQGWDGRHNGEPQPMGVYVYVVEARGMNGESLQKQGNVTLIR